MKKTQTKALTVISPNSAIAESITPPPKRHEVIAAAVKRAEQLFNEERGKRIVERDKSKLKLDAEIMKELKHQQKNLAPRVSYWSDGNKVDVGYSLVVSPELKSKVQAHKKLEEGTYRRFDEKETRRSVTEAMRGGSPGDRVSAILSNPETVKALDTILLAAGI
jgi:hypothetical protein